MSLAHRIAPPLLLLLIIIIASACGSGDGPLGGSPDAASSGADAAGSDSAADASTDLPDPDCSAIPSHAATVDFGALADDIADAARAAGEENVNIVPTAEVIIFGGLSVGFAGAPDPAAAALAWIDALAPALFDSTELTAENQPAWDTADGAAIVYMRREVAGVATRFFRPALVAHLHRDGDQWTMSSFTLYASVALAPADEVAALVACTPSAPPPQAPTLAATFAGLMMINCGPVGEYAYQPDAADTISWSDDITWEAAGDHWDILRDGTLEIAPENYFPDIEQADCNCGDRVGFEIGVDANSGELLRYRPGILCVVC